MKTYIYAEVLRKLDKESVATGSWTRLWYVKANSEEEALAKLNDAMDAGTTHSSSKTDASVTTIV